MYVNVLTVLYMYFQKILP